MYTPAGAAGRPGNTQSKENSMRLRFAPSPTGYLHIGNARTAVLNYLLARSTTPPTSFASEEHRHGNEARASPRRPSLDDLRWLGIRWNEGPDAGGEFAPTASPSVSDIYKNIPTYLLTPKKGLSLLTAPRTSSKRCAPGGLRGPGARSSIPGRCAGSATPRGPRSRHRAESPPCAFSCRTMKPSS